MKILLLENDKTLRNSIKTELESNDYTVDDFSSGIIALESVYSKTYDLLILDISVPGLNGFDLLDHITQSKMLIPSIFLTTQDNLDYLKRGFDTGCCDYIKKPFTLNELKLRVSSALKIFSMNKMVSSITLPFDYEYNRKDSSLSKSGELISLSKTEQMLLELFIANRNKIVTSQMIQDSVWKHLVDPTNIRVQINNLRKKLNKDLICNVRGEGYILET